jgi:hypothetical protein
MRHQNGREIVGPSHEEEDVTDISSRALVLRAIHESLVTRHDVGTMLAEVGRIASEASEERAESAIDRAKTRALVDSIEKRLSATQAEIQRAPSKHDLEQAAQAARDEAETTGRHNLQELKLELKTEKVEDLTEEKRAIRNLRFAVYGSVFAGVILAVLTFVAARLIH